MGITVIQKRLQLPKMSINAASRGVVPPSGRTAAPVIYSQSPLKYININLSLIDENMYMENIKAGRFIPAFFAPLFKWG